MARFCAYCGKPTDGGRFCPDCRPPEDTYTEPGAEHEALEEPAGGSGISDTVLRIAAAKQGEEALARPEPYGRIPAAFGRYRVLREVGRGAMSVVYLARDDAIGRSVAIKSLHVEEGLPDDEKREIRDRFQREAQAAGGLSHPNIVTVFDVGEEGGNPYIAMEYLEGATLTEVAREMPLSIPQVVGAMKQVLAALDYAHGHQVVHRDIKPDNIFVMHDGRVKVADFGIARITSSIPMTSVGQVIGTPGYMSPEQVKGEPVGPASDIFSAGVVLYELLTGTAAFASTTPTSVMYKIVHEEPRPPHLINPAVPYNLEAVIAKATAKSPGGRYRTAYEMMEDIERERAPEPAPVRAAHGGTVLRGAPMQDVIPVSALKPEKAAASVRKRQAWPAVLIALGVVVLAGAAVAVAMMLLLGNKVSIAFVEPKSGARVSGDSLDVDLSVAKPDKVDHIEIQIDGRWRGTLKGGATNMVCYFDPGDAAAGEDGRHAIVAKAYDTEGAVLSRVESYFYCNKMQQR